MQNYSKAYGNSDARLRRKRKVPPYMVFADKTLAGMCVMRPATLDEMLEVSGVGEHKLEKYGDRFLEIIRKG